MKDLDQFITDEMLAAYLDGNAIPLEKNIIGSYIESDELQELLEIVSDIKTNPELIDSGENLHLEIPDKLFEETDSPLQAIKREIDETNKHLM